MLQTTSLSKRILRSLADLLPGYSNEKKLWMSAVDDPRINVRLVISSQPKKAEESEAIFESLQRGCRDFPEEVMYKLKDGSKISGESLIFKKRISLKVKNKGLISSDELYSPMKDWLGDLIEKKRIIDDDSID